METSNFLTVTTLLYTILIIAIFTTLASHTFALDPYFEACVPKTCGNGLNISYPFWIAGKHKDYCGNPNFVITCNDEKEPVLMFPLESYIIKHIFYANQTLIVVHSTAYNTCPTPLYNPILGRTPFSFDYFSVHTLYFFYNCTRKPPQYTYPIDCASSFRYYSFVSFHEKPLLKANYPVDLCRSSAFLPVDIENEVDLRSTNYVTLLKKGFLLNWTAENCASCESSGGRCGFKDSKFVCFCIDKPHIETCYDARKPHEQMKVIIGVTAGFGSMGIMAMISLIWIYYYRKTHAPSPYTSHNISSDPSSLVADREQVEKFPGVHLFAYSELEEATNNFDSAKELGDGAFGTVYYGKLHDGRAVAVKRLYENNHKKVEHFMNEVKILADLRHQNLVTLYGCTSRHSRELLIVYEYVSNGTAADHLHGERANPGALPWAIRLNIAIETASALQYLHASTIIHRDVKTDNILLDDNFCVKVADFGLSRLFPDHVTHVSTAPQGTPGYVDPEYHQCYQLTTKSDVFSFGVVLVELISSMRAVDITRHRNDINLSNLFITKIQNKALHELVDSSLGFESDDKVRKMIHAVAELAFQCLQGDRDMRPTMTTVLETLKDIRNDGRGKDKVEELDISDEVGLLKNGLPAPSPDSRASTSYR